MTSVPNCNEEMAKQKARSKEDSKKTLGDWIDVHDGNTEFVGYDDTEVKTEISRYFVDGNKIIDLSKEIKNESCERYTCTLYPAVELLEMPNNKPVYDLNR